jgi:hypothetical protein
VLEEMRMIDHVDRVRGERKPSGDVVDHDVPAQRPKALPALAGDQQRNDRAEKGGFAQPKVDGPVDVDDLRSGTDLGAAPQIQDSHRYLCRGDIRYAGRAGPAAAMER